MGFPSDLEIASAAELRPPAEIAGRLGIPEEFLEPYGRTVAKIDLGILTARTMAASLEGTRRHGTPSRAEANALLRGVLEGTSPKDVLSLSTCWEPNAFDGKDKDYVGRPGHDATGRFIPYWNRGDGTKAVLEPLVDYEKPGAGDWYLVARNSGRESIMEPYFYPIAGDVSPVS